VALRCWRRWTVLISSSTTLAAKRFVGFAAWGKKYASCAIQERNPLHSSANSLLLWTQDCVHTRDSASLVICQPHLLPSPSLASSGSDIQPVNVLPKQQHLQPNPVAFSVPWKHTILPLIMPSFHVQFRFCFLPQVTNKTTKTNHFRDLPLHQRAQNNLAIFSCKYPCIEVDQDQPSLTCMMLNSPPSTPRWPAGAWSLSVCCLTGKS
jgi:hypothetical protein